jgi:hypothetical protein
MEVVLSDGGIDVELPNTPEIPLDAVFPGAFGEPTSSTD